MSARNRQHNDYPTATQRIERARELGIRSAGDPFALNPFARCKTGWPLYDAWDFGRTLGQGVDAADYIAVCSDLVSVDRSADFTDVCREIEATVPCGWPRERRECAA